MTYVVFTGNIFYFKVDAFCKGLFFISLTKWLVIALLNLDGWTCSILANLRKLIYFC